MAMAEVRSRSTTATLTLDLFEQWFDEEIALLAEVPNIAEAAVMHNMIVADGLIEFLTLPAYALLDDAPFAQSGSASIFRPALYVSCNRSVSSPDFLTRRCIRFEGRSPSGVSVTST